MPNQVTTDVKSLLASVWHLVCVLPRVAFRRMPQSMHLCATHTAVAFHVNLGGGNAMPDIKMGKACCTVFAS